MSRDPIDTVHPARMSLRSLLVPLALVLTSLLAMRGMSERKDLDPWDTVTYQLQGQALLEGRFSEVDLAWSPPFSLAYAGVMALAPNPAKAQDWMAWILVPAFVLLLWGFLFMTSGPWPAAFLSLAWIGAPPLLGNGGPPGTGVYLFGLCPLLAAWIALGRGRRLLCLLFCGLAAWNRLELGILPIVLTVAWGWQGMRTRARPLQIAAGFAALLSLVLISFILFHPQARERSRLAFRQNMAVSLQERGIAPSGLDPAGQAVAAPDTYLAKVFPTARSWPKALRENPGQVLLHALHGMQQLPGQLFALLTQVHLDRPILRVLMGAWIFLLLALGSSLLLGKSRRLPGGDVRGERVSEALRHMRPLLLGTFLLLLPIAVLRPRIDFLAPLLPVLLLALALPIRSAIEKLSEKRAWRTVFPFAFLALWSPLWLWTPLPVEAPKPLRFREAVSLLHQAEPQRGTRIMAFEGAHLAFLADPSLVGVGLPSMEPPAWKGWQFQRILEELDPQILLVDDWFRLLAARHPGLDEALAGSQWQLMALTPRVFLYRVRD